MDGYFSFGPSMPSGPRSKGDIYLAFDQNQEVTFTEELVLIGNYLAFDQHQEKIFTIELVFFGNYLALDQHQKKIHNYCKTRVPW